MVEERIKSAVCFPKDQLCLNQCGFCAGALSSPEELKSYISKDELSGQHTCVICNYANRNAGNVRNHVESRHFPNMFEYTCKICGDLFGTKTQLNNHLARSHKKLHM